MDVLQKEIEKLKKVKAALVLQAERMNDIARKSADVARTDQMAAEEALERVATIETAIRSLCGTETLRESVRKLVKDSLAESSIPMTREELETLIVHAGFPRKLVLDVLVDEDIVKHGTQRHPTYSVRK